MKALRARAEGQREAADRLPLDVGHALGCALRVAVYEGGEHAKTLLGRQEGHAGLAFSEGLAHAPDYVDARWATASGSGPPGELHALQGAVSF